MSEIQYCKDRSTSNINVPTDTYLNMHCTCTKFI